MKDPVQVHVGNGHRETRSFTVDRSSICLSSTHLAQQYITARGPINLDADPDMFEMFQHWLIHWESQTSPDEDIYLEEPWLSRTAEAWIFAEELQAPLFAMFCFTRFISNCTLAPFGSWGLIESKTDATSPLRRFSNHWIAWNANLLSGCDHEYIGLEAVAFASQVTKYTGDPREYEETHWYLPCGDHISPHCDHNPVVQKEKAANSQLPTPAPAQWGYDLER